MTERGGKKKRQLFQTTFRWCRHWTNLVVNIEDTGNWGCERAEENLEGALDPLKEYIGRKEYFAMDVEVRARQKVEVLKEIDFFV